MINPQLLGRYLFIRNDCLHCKKWETFVFKFNFQLKRNKRVMIIDCTKFYYYGIYDHPIIKLFEDYIDEFPVIFIDGEKKSGTNSILECEAWIKARLFSDFYFPQMPEYLEEIDKYTIFNEKCQFRKGRIVCEKIA